MSDEPFLCVPTPPDPVAVLRAENERLRAENERLREELRRIAAIDSSPRRTWIIEVENDFLAEVEKLRALPHCSAIYGVGSSTPQLPNMRPITEAQITELMAAIPRADEVDRLRAENERLRAENERLDNEDAKTRHALKGWVFVPPDGGAEPTHERVAAVVAEVERLREALKPFATLAPHFDGHHGTRPRAGAIFMISTGGLPDAEITVEDLHRARDPLKEGGR